jgi:hypothetical protein
MSAEPGRRSLDLGQEEEEWLREFRAARCSIVRTRATDEEDEEEEEEEEAGMGAGCT